MALPKQVQKQADEVSKFEAQVAEAANKAVEEPPKDPEPQEPKPTDDGQEPQAKEPEVPKAPEPKPAEDDAAVWKQRFQSLQGMYNSQVPALQQQVKTLSDELATAIEQIKKSAEKPREPEQSGPLVTSKDVDAFGEDLVDLARRIAAEEFGKREKQYITKIDSLEAQLADATGRVSQVAQTQSRTAAEVFFDRLGATVPNWEAVQNTQECQSWLGTRVPGTVLTWDDVLKDAASRHDLARTVEVFNTFFERFPQFNPAAKPVEPVQNNRTELERQVAPTKSKASAAPAQGSRRVYSSAEYQNESMRQVRLIQQGKYDEATRLEAELNAALAEGRVKP